MVAVVKNHDIKWLSPSPIWDKFGDLSSVKSRQLFARPTILRFNKDDFMDEFLSVMSYYPDRLIEWKARPETWREPMPTPKTASQLSSVEPRSTFSKRQKRRLESFTREKPEFDAAKLAQDDQALAMAETGLLKLYQPAQQRYYLISASLVCRERGLPDRVIDTAKQEQVNFVLRRLVARSDQTKLEDYTTANCDEYAYVLTESGFKWRNINDDPEYDQLDVLPGEERLPMVSVGFDDLHDRKRRLVAGFISVAKREAYLAAGRYAGADPTQGDPTGAGTGEGTISDEQARQAIKALFEHQVAAPWKAMIGHAITVNEGIDTDDFDDDPENSSEYLLATANANNVVNEARAQFQITSWYVLLDLAGFLEQYLPAVWAAVFDASLKDTLNEQEASFYSALETITISPSTYSAADLYLTDIAPSPDANYYISGLRANTQYQLADIKSSLIDALVAIKGGTPFNQSNAADLEEMLEGNDFPYDPSANDVKALWPSFLFPLADPMKADALPDLPVDAGITDDLDQAEAKIDELTKLAAKALTVASKPVPELVTFAEVDQNSSGSQLSARDGVFIIRCIYERPNCGPFNPPVVSEPSEEFEMASFFDSGAPGRPVRIPMPLDISPAGLRKFNKNTTFMISDMLCGKIKSIRKITFGDLVLSVLPWPFHKDLPSVSKTGPCGEPGNTFGMFCSLSIPIVTLCALILLIIMVTLFDIFFKWIPLLFTCFKLPGLSGKNQ